MNEEEKYLDWYEKEKKKGLEDIKFCTGDLSQTSKETFFQEANIINKAIKVRGVVTHKYLKKGKT